eukprot:3333696-Amphidinium_carterae.3
MIPVAMTSKLWWTKMVDPDDEAIRDRNDVEPAEAPVEESSSNMSPWRNLVRAWEMRNHDRLQRENWHVVTYHDSHPADMEVQR